MVGGLLLLLVVVVQLKKIMTANSGKLTSRLCRPRLVLGPGCLARSAAPGYPRGSKAKLEVVPSHFQCFVVERRKLKTI